MKRILLPLLAVPALLAAEAAFSADPDCGAPDFCRPEVARINAAFLSGMARAGDAEARLLCLRLRNAALALVVESTYQATLAWAADRPDFLDALQKDQARWQNGLEADESGNTTASLERRADAFLERLRLLGLIADGRTAEAFLVG